MNAPRTDGRPNVVLILADDMGFADLGVMGSEIRTPNIDAMARQSALLSSMYNCARYDGVYAHGWDAVRSARHEEMPGRGLLPHRWAISPRDADAPAWTDARHRDWEASRMAVYAAMVDRMDQSIGRVMTALKRLGQHENTLVLFLSDNGGCAELMAEDGWAKFYPDVHNDGRRIAMGNRPGLRPGGPLTFMSYDLPWANVSNAPFRLFKHWVHEGGISTPLVAQWPARIRQGTIAHSPSHVIDLLPTILDATGTATRADLGGHAVQTPDGESLLPLLEGRSWARDQPLAWEHEGNCAIHSGPLKLVRRFGHDWELYDMERDRTELHDLAGTHRETREELVREYRDWAVRCGVVEWETLQPALLRAWNLAKVDG